MPRRLTLRRPSPAVPALVLLLALAFALRVWGVRSGLPYAFNADENAHFAPRAIGLFGHDWDPGYHVNPPAYTYLLHIVFDLWYGGREAVYTAFASDPGGVFAVARVTSAILGTIAVWLLYLAAARLFDRGVALLAAALLSVSFLAVFYSHLALNDVPALAPVALALWATAGVLREGRARDHAIAGAAVGLAIATKYTAGVALLPLATAIGIGLADRGRRGRHTAGAAIALVAMVAAFVAADPYAILDWSAFREGVTHQTSTAADAAGKLGLTQESGTAYYLWTFTWGLGWIPLAAAVGGAGNLLRLSPRLALVLVPAPILFVLFMGGHERYFGRWLLPVFPIVCILAAYGALSLARKLTERRAPTWRALAAAVAVAALCAQGLVYSIHNDTVLARDDTRNLTRAWMVEHIPEGSKIVVEPVAPDGWAQDVGRPSAKTANGNRWSKFPTTRAGVEEDAPTEPGSGRTVVFEDYVSTLSPRLVRYYERRGYCWVITGSIQRGRAEAEPRKVPRAIAYYRELERRADVVFRSSPFDAGAKPVAFNFDWSFDYYPLAYHRPGPEMTVYRLRTGACAGVS